MRIHLTDEHEWTESFDWRAPSQAVLKEGVQAALAKWREHIGVETHPGIALRRRMAEIDAWEKERAGRTNATEDARRSWRAQVFHWRHQARRQHEHDMGLDLRVAVASEVVENHLLCPGNRMPAPRVGDLDLDDPAVVQKLWDDCALIVEHDRNIAALAGMVGDSVKEASHRPGLHLVRSAEDAGETPSDDGPR